MAKSCKGLAMELVKCLSETDCVKVGRLLPPLLLVHPRPACRCLFRSDWVLAQSDYVQASAGGENQEG